MVLNSESEETPDSQDELTLEKYRRADDSKAAELPGISSFVGLSGLALLRRPVKSGQVVTLVVYAVNETRSWHHLLRFVRELHRDSPKRYSSYVLFTGLSSCKASLGPQPNPAKQSPIQGLHLWEAELGAGTQNAGGIKHATHGPVN